ncbi:unnamed protein product [Heterobilharzia americana]|nr:unnamed protein product [Heterobilharzia americana]
MRRKEVKNHRGVNAVCESNTESIAGPSFLHTYLMKTREVESEDVNSRKLLRITTRSATLPSAKPDQITNSLLSPTDDQDDAEDEDDSSEESEWSPILMWILAGGVDSVVEEVDVRVVQMI